ncbi:hypothetical protein [Photobacterium leiognathi]|uniref:hypothetical protein n=1 Tax=Photobacterium leiognathi TaxID=553611 RepID=UPI002980E59A|nr:hypothetical protein [Photobacterium leiognathi]
MSFEFGTVEWFGGFSEKMNRELEYGFIKPIISASDFTSKSDYLISLKEANIFVHKKALVNAESLNSDDYVMFKIEERNGKKSAQCVHNINKESLDENILEAVISGISSNEDVISNNVLKMIIAEILRSSHAKRFISKLYEVKSLSTVIGYLKLVLIDSPHVSEFLDSNLSVEQRILDYPETITNSFINSDAAFNGFCKILTNKQEDEKIELLKTIGIKFNHSKIIDLIFDRSEVHSIKAQYWSGYYFSNLKDSLRQAFVDNSTDKMQLINQYGFSCVEEFDNHPIVKEVMLPLKVKDMIFNKDMTFVDLVQNNEFLKEDPELWILSKLIPILGSYGYQDEFLSVLHEEIYNGSLDPNHKSLLKLFPQCTTMSYRSRYADLSCEAFHWKTIEGEMLFLCRGKKCNYPEVMPNINISHYDYSIYSWFQHYGVTYIGGEQNPSKSDYPIKLAGYINRLKEIRPLLNCTCCGALMKPNMVYAKSAAAYRTTVFKCVNETCLQTGENIYINHCNGLKCGEIIDSRTSKGKCPSGWHICQSCNSCCGQNHF